MKTSEGEDDPGLETWPANDAELLEHRRAEQHGQKPRPFEQVAETGTSDYFEQLQDESDEIADHTRQALFDEWFARSYEYRRLREV
jgi:hypothetical protein